MTFPQHIQNFHENVLEAMRLHNIHSKLSGNKVGRKNNLEILNKSAIVLLTACWESYIEELASLSFDYLVENATSHDQIPSSVLVKASTELKNSSDNRKIWALAGTGWKKILGDYKHQIIRKEVDYFHVPRPENIDLMFEKLLGIQKLSSTWKWKKMSNVKALKTLNDFIDLRGSIAHKVKTSKSVLKKEVYYYGHFINCLAVKVHNIITRHLISQIGTAPWVQFSYKTII